MARGTCNSGYTPRQARFIRQDCSYEVQPGQRVSDICYLFGIPMTRWAELVGANLHKPLGPAPYGFRQRCFQNLEAGERLNIPAKWNPYNRRSPGAVSGAPPYGQAAEQLPGLVTIPEQSGLFIDRLELFVDALMSTQVPKSILNQLATLGVDLPSNVTIEDALAVMFSWWPYVDWPMPGGQVPPLPTPSTPLPAGVDIGVLGRLGAQAVEFLRATGITNGKSPNVQNIPWDAIRWNDVPWQVLGTQALQELSQVMGGTPIPPHTTPPVAMAGQAPNFFEVSWRDQPWASILKDVEFNDSIVDVLGDPDAVECIKKDPQRLKELNGCPECYSEGTDKFKQLLCSTEPNPCDCNGGGGGGGGGGEQPPVEEESNTPLIVGGVAVGVMFLGLMMMAGRK